MDAGSWLGKLEEGRPPCGYSDSLYTHLLYVTSSREVSPLKPKAKPVVPELKRMNLNVERHLHDQFKAATAADGKDMTTVLTDFIQEYVVAHLPESLRRRGERK